jgi:hypothetical protein
MLFNTFLHFCRSFASSCHSGTCSSLNSGLTCRTSLLRRAGSKKRGGAGGLFAREARGLQVVRGVDLKGPKAAGMAGAGRVTGTQWEGGVSVPN